MEAPARVFVAPGDLEHELRAELGPRAVDLGAGLFASADAAHAAWSQCTWLEPRILPIASIGDANKQLRAMQRNWVLHPTQHVRRARLIEDKLPKLKGRVLVFPEEPPASPVGAWTLLDRDHVLASPTTDRPFPGGIARFEHNRDEPPSRAYLKLWEALTLLGDRPRPGQRCIDLGSSPGGWTWVCAKLGASVLSVDKAPLDEAVARMPGVEQHLGSAFALEPASLGALDWVLSDVICYPPRLLRLVREFIAAGVGTTFVCTLKFQGSTDHETVRAFANIEGSRLLHLSHNKHELTWMYQPGEMHFDG